MVKPKRTLDERLADPEASQAAMRMAFRDAILEHRRWGHPMVFWQDGKIVWIPADQVALPPEEDLSKYH